jgi:dephospho-CoA kinase
MVVGLTGRYCAGKDMAARIFARKGFHLVDVDSLGHEVLAEKAAEVAAAFGPSVVGPGGAIDRRGVARAVFGDPAALRRLEAIVHPAMVDRVRASIAGLPGDVVVNAAILQRMGLVPLCDAVVWVTAPAAVRLLRALRRDRMRLRDAVARMRSQADVRPQFNDPAVDTYIVRNGGTARSLERRVEAVLRRMKDGEG